MDAYKLDISFFASDEEVRRKAIEQVNALLQKRKEYYSSVGYDPEAAAEYTADDYQMLALYHTNVPYGPKGKPISAESIGRKFGRSKGSVEKRINALYEFLDLAPKEGGGGRKRRKRRTSIGCQSS